MEIFNPVTSVAEDYLVDHRTGYCEGDYYRWLYFKTDVQSQYARGVYYAM